MDVRETFNNVASVYDAARPDYPAALFEEIASFAHIEPKDSILEIGCGSGQASRSLAQLNCRVVALDPGPELLRIARERLAAYTSVEFVQSSFEAWQPPTSAFKLVVAAQSFHWLAPEERFAKSAAALQPGGVLAVFGNVPLPLQPPLREEVEQCYARHAPHLIGPPPECWYLPSGPVPGIFAESSQFSAVKHHCYPWSRQHTGATYTNLLRSLSSHQMLPAETREALLGKIEAAVAKLDGALELQYESHLYCARRAA